MPSVTPNQNVFIEAYLSCWNATEAARQAGYAHPNKQGPRLLVKDGIQAVIHEKLTERAMSATEVLARLAEHARGSLRDFIIVDDQGHLQGFDLSDDKPLHLLKKVAITHTRYGTNLTIELYDAQAALEKLARYHGLFVERHELTGKAGQPIEVSDARSRFLDALNRVRAASDDNTDLGRA